MAESMDKPQPVYQTESIDDLEALLGKAEMWAESMGREGIAAEFRDGREFVSSELLEDDDEEKELVTDGGQFGTGVEQRESQLELQQRTECQLENVDETWIVEELDNGDKILEAIQKVRNDHDTREIVKVESIWLLDIHWNENTDSVWAGTYGYHGGFEVSD